MLFSLTLNIDENVIKIYNHKKIELFYYDLIDIALESSRYIDQSKKYHFVLKVAIVGPEDHLPFITLFDLYAIVSISLIKLGKTSNPTYSIK